MAGIECGSQVTVCRFPIHLDTYTGCSHECAYCFARAKQDLSNIKPTDCSKAVRSFTQGKRTQTTNWCDWDIPLHWGGLSDPFQPAEREYGASLKVLRVLAETGYPFIVSTKGILLTEEPYLSLISECNVVVQISMLCSALDKVEPGAPTYEQRLEMVRVLSERGLRVVARAQPYLTNLRREIARNIPRLKEAGAHAITFEGMKFKVKKPGLVRVGGDWCYPENVLRDHYGYLKEICARAGIMFLCAENRLRNMGDSMDCCTGGAPGFEGNCFNCVDLTQGGAVIEPGEAMCLPGTAGTFKTMNQTTAWSRYLNGRAFAEVLVEQVPAPRSTP